MNKNTITHINNFVNSGFRYFYFDQDDFNLIEAKIDNIKSFYDLDIARTIKLCITKETTENYIIEQLKYYKTK